MPACMWSSSQMFTMSRLQLVHQRLALYVWSLRDIEEWQQTTIPGVCLLCVLVSSCKNTSGVRPTRRASIHLYPHFEGPVSEYSLILRYWAWGLQHTHFEVDNSSHNTRMKNSKMLKFYRVICQFFLPRIDKIMRYLRMRGFCADYVFIPLSSQPTLCTLCGGNHRSHVSLPQGFLVGSENGRPNRETRR